MKKNLHPFALFLFQPQNLFLLDHLMHEEEKFLQKRDEDSGERLRKCCSKSARPVGGAVTLTENKTKTPGGAVFVILGACEREREMDLMSHGNIKPEVYPKMIDPPKRIV